MMGLPGLAQSVPVANSGLQHAPVLVPSHEGCSLFGLVGVPARTNLEQERASITLQTLVSARWVLGLEWVSLLSAWDALLFTFDHLDPGPLSLSVSLMLPLLFVTRMADQPRAAVFEHVHAWTPLLEESQKRLLPLLIACALHWYEGPSQVAEARRARNQEQGAHLEPEDRIIFQTHLDAFGQLVGRERLEALRHAERLAPALLRLFDQVSCDLWDPSSPLGEQHHLALRASPALRGLLPIALWNAQAPSALNGGAFQHPSLERLYTLWQARHKPW